MKYHISILAQIGATITVEADNAEEAEQQAHELFDPSGQLHANDHYSQETHEIYEDEDEDEEEDDE